MLRKEILRTDRVSNDRGAEIDIAARACFAAFRSAV